MNNYTILIRESRFFLGSFPITWEQRKLGDEVQITMGQSPDGSTYTDIPSDYILVQGGYSDRSEPQFRRIVSHSSGLTEPSFRNKKPGYNFRAVYMENAMIGFIQAFGGLVRQLHATSHSIEAPCQLV